MKNLLVNVALALLAIFMIAISFEQCSKKTEARKTLESVSREKLELYKKHLALLKSKTKTDTIYRNGQTQYVSDTVFKAITDTLIVNGTDTLQCYESVLNRTDLSLKANIWAVRLHSIDYEYNVTEKEIIINHIQEIHDTIIRTKYRSQLLGIVDAGKSSFTIGLQYQSKSRIGIIARSNWFDNKRYYSFGMSYRIF